jgi:hypothetical protein
VAPICELPDGLPLVPTLPEPAGGIVADAGAAASLGGAVMPLGVPPGFDGVAGVAAGLDGVSGAVGVLAVPGVVALPAGGVVTCG